MRFALNDRVLIFLSVLVLIFVGITAYLTIIVCWDATYDERAKTPLATFFGVAYFLEAVVAIIAGLYGFSYYRKRPRLVVGVINPTEAKRYFTRIDYDEVHFKPGTLAPYINDPISIEKLESRLNKGPIQNIEPDENRHGKVFIVFQNLGARIAENYSLTITFDSSIDIVNVESENLNIDSIYTTHPEYIKDATLLSFLPSPSVMDFYNGLYDGIGLSQAYIKFTDSIDGFGYETICLTLHVPMETSHFRIFYRCDCPDIFPQRKMYAQRIDISTTINLAGI